MRLAAMTRASPSDRLSGSRVVRLASCGRLCNKRAKSSPGSHCTVWPRPDYTSEKKRDTCTALFNGPCHHICLSATIFAESRGPCVAALLICAGMAGMWLAWTGNSAAAWPCPAATRSAGKSAVAQQVVSVNASSVSEWAEPPHRLREPLGFTRGGVADRRRVVRPVHASPGATS